VSEVQGTPSFGFGPLDRADGRLYALGYGDIGYGGGAVVWTTIDGSNWTRVKSGSFKGHAVREVIDSRVGTLAAGFNAPPGSDNTSGFVTWPVRNDGSFGRMRVVDVSTWISLVAGAVWTGDEFLAWGGRAGPYPSRVVTVLTSPDGQTWSVRGEIRTDKRSFVAQIIKQGDRLIAVGDEGVHVPLTPRAWTSNDGGRTWKSAEVEGVGAAMVSIALEGTQLVARGLQSSSGEYDIAVSWISTRGRLWAREPEDHDLPAVPGFNGLAPVTIAGRKCVAGSIDGEQSSSAAIYCRAAG
jgi:hypothetical protein